MKRHMTSNEEGGYEIFKKKGSEIDTCDVENCETNYDPESALNYLLNLFPFEKFDGQLPALIYQHQLYSLVKNRSLVDKKIDDLQKTLKIKLFKLSYNSNEFLIIQTDSYINHLKKYNELHSAISNELLIEFIDKVVKKLADISYNKEQLINLTFTQSQISELVQGSILVIRDVGSWWLNIPNIGLFVRQYEKGKKTILNAIKRSKYREILLSELETRPFLNSTKLGFNFHLHDIIGADLVKTMNTTSGLLLILSEKHSTLKEW